MILAKLAGSVSSCLSSERIVDRKVYLSDVAGR
jgi:hypothetical protein